MAARNGVPASGSSFDPIKYSSQNPPADAGAQVADQAAEVDTEGNTDPVTNVDDQDEPLCTVTHNFKASSIVETNQIYQARDWENPADYDPASTRRLVSLREISKIHNAKVGNRWLSFAQVDGWTCLVPHGAFKAGELVLYFQIDSLLPASDDSFGKMSQLQTYEGKLCHRVKTRKFGTGDEVIVLQGYVYPIEKFDIVYRQVKAAREGLEMSTEIEWTPAKKNFFLLVIFRRTNWAERLGIKKWEETVHIQSSLDRLHPKLGKTPTGLFPKTDITRVEDCRNLFKKRKYTTRGYQESVKMDGASMTVYFVTGESRRFAELNPLPATVGPNTVLANGRFGVCSKNVDLNELASGKGDFGFWAAALRHGLPAKLSALGRGSLAVHGELCGAGINGNREGIPGDETEFFVFGAFDIDRQRHVDPRRVLGLAAELGLRHVSVLGIVMIPHIASNHEDLKRRARESGREGLVYKCLLDGRSFKVISSAYLLEHNL